MPRSRPEWIGRDNDAKAPPRVRERNFDAHKGICHWCKLPIKPGETWHADHVIALIEGGENRESNLAPIHAHCHVEKTNGEKARKSKVARVKQKHTGAVRPKGQIQSRGFEKRERPVKLPMPPRKRPMYERAE